MENRVRTIILSMISGVVTAAAVFLLLPANIPEKGSMEAMQLCDRLFKEEVLTGEHIESWLVKPMIEKFDREIASLPEAAQVDVIEKTELYIDEIKSGKVTEKSINNVAYIINQAKPAK